MIGKKIILVAGGTGGHVFPAISLAERLKGMGHDILIITDLRGKRFEIEKNGVPVKYISVKNPSQKNVFLKMIAFFSLIKSTILSWKIISDFRADVIVGFGGYPKGNDKSQPEPSTTSMDCCTKYPTRRVFLLASLNMRPVFLMLIKLLTKYTMHFRH